MRCLEVGRTKASAKGSAKGSAKECLTHEFVLENTLHSPLVQECLTHEFILENTLHSPLGTGYSKMHWLPVNVYI